MSADLHQLVGEANGKLDTLTRTLERYIEAHERRHENIDAKIEAHAKDINQAKGAKGAVLLFAGGVATVVSAAAVAAMKLFGH